MPAKSHKQSVAPRLTTSAPETRQRVKLRKPVEPASGSKRPTAVKPKKAVKPGASAKRQVIPPATRAQHRPPSTAKKSATFILDAPTGRDVAVAGSFNNWQPQDMTKGPDGLWRISVQLTPGTYQYKFLVDTQWQEDPSNPRKTPNEHGGFNSTCDVL